MNDEKDQEKPFPENADRELAAEARRVMREEEPIPWEEVERDLFPASVKPVQDQSSENKQLFVDPDDESGQVKFE